MRLINPSFFLKYLKQEPGLDGIYEAIERKYFALKALYI